MNERTKEQVENVNRLIAGLASLPVNYKKFHMSFFTDNVSDSFIVENNGSLDDPDHCGTTACIVGHGPSFGVTILKQHLRPSNRIDWALYSEESFGFYDHNGWQNNLSPELFNDWTFCFGEDWPDSIPEAIARLKVANEGNIPAEWDYDLRYTEEGKE